MGYPYEKELMPALTAAEETIKFIKETLAGEVCLAFWEELQTQISAEMGKTSALESIPLTKQQAKEFEKEKIPIGKYAGMRVATVYDRDKDHLIRLCYRPSLFQSRLRRYMAGRGKNRKRT